MDRVKKSRVQEVRSLFLDLTHHRFVARGKLWGAQLARNENVSWTYVDYRVTDDVSWVWMMRFYGEI